jgi:hypothetical protein
MTAEDWTLNQIMRDRWGTENQAEQERQRVAREHWLSSALDISPDAARDLNKLIKDRLEDIFDRVREVEQLILEAYDRRAWQALGYSTWKAYVKPEAQAEVTRLVSEGTPPSQAIHTVVEQLSSPPPISKATVMPVESLPQAAPVAVERVETPVEPAPHHVLGYTKPPGILGIDMRISLSEVKAAIKLGVDPVHPQEPLVRPDGHEDRVRKFQAAVIALYELANEVYDLSGSDDECIDNLRLIDDDALELADSQTAVSIRETVGKLTRILDW